MEHESERSDGRRARNLVVLTSTFPRWHGDATPSFVYDISTNIGPMFGSVTVIAPHFAGAATRERLDGISVRRFRYLWPATAEDIAYEGGAVAKIRRTPGYAVKLVAFLCAFFAHTLAAAITDRRAILNAHWLIPQGFVAVLAKLMTGRRVVINVHGGDVFTLNHGLLRRIKRFTLRHADAVIVNSSATKRACEQLFPGRAYTTIPEGVEVSRTFTAKARSAEIADALSLGDFTVLFVGRLSEEKGAVYACQAVERLVARHPGLRLLIVGEGPDRPNIERYVDAHGLGDVVSLLGWKQHAELVDYYVLADVFLGPSIQTKSGWVEAFGLVFAEALATGTPVIATATGGIADIVRDGVNGYLVPQRDPDAIADKLELLLDDPAELERLARNARQDVAERFSWETLIGRYVEVYREL